MTQPSAFRLGWHYPEGDPSILLFDRAVRQWGLDLPRGARVLELGCCETNFHEWLLKADPTIQLTGVDVSPCPGYSGTFIQGDAADYANVRLPHDTYEAVIFLGSLEHFGLGYYGDPVNPHADMTALWRAYQVLAPGGWCYYDVPWTPGQGYITDNRHFRVYDDAQIATHDRAGFRALKRMYAHGETNAEQPIRPTSPTTPFWYLQRLLEKPA